MYKHTPPRAEDQRATQQGCGAVAAAVAHGYLTTPHQLRLSLPLFHPLPLPLPPPPLRRRQLLLCQPEVGLCVSEVGLCGFEGFSEIQTQALSLFFRSRQLLQGFMVWSLGFRVFEVWDVRSRIEGFGV
jgi:hypothetical protein